MGKITIDTSLDNSGFEKGYNEILKKMDELIVAIANGFDSIATSSNKLAKATSSNTTALAKLAETIGEITPASERAADAMGEVSAEAERVNESTEPIAESLQEASTAAEEALARFEAAEEALARFESVLEAIEEMPEIEPISEETVASAEQAAEAIDPIVESMQDVSTEAEEALRYFSSIVDNINNISESSDNAANRTSIFAGFVDKVRDAFSSMGSKGEESTEAATSAIMKQQAVVDELRAKIQSLAEYEVKAPVAERLTADLQAAEAETERLTAQFEAAVAELEELRSIGFAETDLSTQIANVDAMAEKLAEAEDKSTALRQELSDLDIPDRPRESAEELESRLAIASRRLEEMQEKAAGVADNVGDINEELEDGGGTLREILEDLLSPIEKAINRIKNLLIGAFIFNVIRKQIKEFRNYINLALKENTQYVRSLAQVNANLKTAFQPILQVIVPALTSLMTALASATRYLVQFVSLISGKSVKASQEAAKNMDALAAATEATGSASKDAGKDAQKMLTAFDEINQLGAETADTDSGAGAGIADALAGYTDIPEPDTTIWDNFKASLQSIADIFMSGFWEGFASADLSGLQTAITGIGASLREIFTDPGVATSFANLINTWIYTLGIFTGGLASIGVSIATGLLGGINLFLDENKGSIRSTLISIFDIASEIIKIVGEWWKALADIFTVFAGENSQRMIAAILGIFYEMARLITEIAGRIGRDFIDLLAQPLIQNKDIIKVALDGILGFFSSILGTIKDLVKSTVDGIIALYDTHIRPFIDNVKKAFTEWYEHLLNGWITYIQPVLDKFAEKFRSVVEDHVGPMIDKLLEFLGKLFDALSLWWNAELRPLVSWIIDVMVPLISVALGVVGDIFLTLLATVSDVVGSIFDVLGGLIDFLVGVFTGDWRLAWEGVKGIFKGLGNSIISIVEGLINGVIAIINGFISGINLAIGVINSIPGVNLKVIPSLGTMSIPRLATGTVVPPNKEFLAVLGDNKNEAEVVSPLSTMKEAFLEAINEANIGGGGDMTLNISGNLAPFFRYLNVELEKSKTRGSALGGVLT